MSDEYNIFITTKKYNHLLKPNHVVRYGMYANVIYKGLTPKRDQVLLEDKNGATKTVFFDLFMKNCEPINCHIRADHPTAKRIDEWVNITEVESFKNDIKSIGYENIIVDK